MLKRPHVDEFLQKMGELFECVLFTASLAKVRLSNTHTHTLLYGWYNQQGNDITMYFLVYLLNHILRFMLSLLVL